MRKKDHACSCAAAPVAHLHHVSILAAGVHPTAYSPRRRPLRASRDESRKSEHVTIRGLNAATRDMALDMAAMAEAARCAASKCRAKRWVTSPVRTLYTNVTLNPLPPYTGDPPPWIMDDPRAPPDPSTRGVWTLEVLGSPRSGENLAFPRRI